MSNLELTSVVFLQLAFMLAAVRIVGIVAARFGQPQVVGEMIAGVLLGPSVFGWMAPEAQAALFPKPSLPILHVLSQVGLILYMFLVGVDFSLDLIRRRLRSAAGVSVAGITSPFLLSSLLALYLFNDRVFFAPGVSQLEATLFMGAAMSITAFPVLARIIHERGLAGTSLGTLALAAGAVDDAAAWCIFAIVLANFTGDARIALLAVGGGLAYLGLLALAKRPVLGRLARAAESREALSGPLFSMVLVLLMLGAWFTDAVGIHGVFGAFMLGTVMPRGVVTRDLERYLKPLTTNLLVPLFFVYSGLNTQLGLVTFELWGVTLIVVAVACAAKLGACWLAARWNGESNREAFALGALMNARGLMELILLNIALERGIIQPTLFTIMVIMAVGTTLMATPLFELVYRRPISSPDVAKVRVAVEV
jgi:K+:H+ antiporter